MIYYYLPPSKISHIDKLDGLRKALLKIRLRISPKKYQLFRKELQYMGNTMFIEDRKVCMKPLRSRFRSYSKAKTANNS